EAGRPPAALGTFDGVVVADAFDRLGGATGHLRPLTGSDTLLRAGGLLLVALPRASAVELANVLGEAFELLSESTEPSLTKADGHRYEITDLEVSVWRKR
ncbi:5-histidylcysteine sulfoxide synthase, partial [Amycolatopsis japonica]